VKKNQLEAIALTGKIKGARPRGQQRMTSRLITNCLWWQMDKYIDTERKEHLLISCLFEGSQQIVRTRTYINTKQNAFKTW